MNKTTREGRSALLYAASKGRENIVTFLLSRGADTNSADTLGATPLHRSVSQSVEDNNGPDSRYIQIPLLGWCTKVYAITTHHKAP